MLPQFLAGSYERYKEDTALFATWLAQAAAACGYKPAGSKAQTIAQSQSQVLEEPTNSKASPAVTSSTRLKGKERKAAKEAAAAAEAQKAKYESLKPGLNAEPTVKYIVTTKDFLVQAKKVADSTKPRIILLTRLRSIVERAIQARQRCAEWFQKSKVRNEYSEDSDRRHVHFIGVLEESLKVLEPCLEPASKSSEGVNVTKETNEDPDPKDLTNRFGMLEVEEASELDSSDVLAILESTNPAKNSPQNVQPANKVYELEEHENTDDIAFEIFCFFEDLHRIQDYIRGVWKSYKNNELDLQTAAVATNAALELVGQEEEKVLAISPKLFDKKRSWDTIAIIIFYADAFQQGISPEARLGTNETLRITPFDDFIYLSTARILMKFIWIHETPAKGGPGYPIPCTPLRFGYGSRPDLLGTPEMDKKEGEDKVLSQFIIDHQLWSMFREVAGARTSKPPTVDEFSKGLDLLLKNGTLSVSLVFSSQVFLDIQDILVEEVGKGFQDLKNLTTELDKIMNLKASGDSWDVGGSGERWHEKDIDTVMRIKMTSLEWVTQARFKKLQEAYALSSRHSVSGTSAEPVIQALSPSHSKLPAKIEQQQTHKKPQPPKNPKFNTVSSRIHKIPDDFTGSKEELAKKLTQELVDSGELPDADGPSEEHLENIKKLNIKLIVPSKDLSSIYSTNPIYCGLVAFNLLTDFEKAGIALCNWHKTPWLVTHLYNALRQKSIISKSWPEMEDMLGIHMGELFSGQLPLSDDEFFTRFALSFGVSAMSFARNQRNHQENALKWRKGVVGTKLRTSPTADIFRRYFDDKDSWDLCLLQIEKSFTVDKKARKGTAVRSLTALQFLEKLKHNLEHEVKILRFDYITLTKQCSKIVKDIRQQLELQLNVGHPRQTTEDSADQFHGIMIF